MHEQEQRNIDQERRTINLERVTTRLLQEQQGLRSELPEAMLAAVIAVMITLRDIGPARRGLGL